MQKFHEYFADWIKTYKLGAVRPITYQKYIMTLRRLTEIAPNLLVSDINKRTYQEIINEYSQTHERVTVMDFHHHLKAAILDIIDEGLLDIDPTRRVVIKGKQLDKKRNKYLSQKELKLLLENLNLDQGINWDWLILICAKTGLRFSEALGLTPNDFLLEEKRLKVTKTWNYKNGCGFDETKNLSSIRTIQIDPKLNAQIRKLVKGLPADDPIFVDGMVFNSTVNNRLKRICKTAGIPIISLHGLRHTHASVLICAGVSIASVSKRLGHSNITTTQETYLHIIRELEDKDNKKMLSGLQEIA